MNRLRLMLGLAFGWALLAFAGANPGPLYRLPDGLVTVTPGAVTVGSGAHTATYVEGLGWLSGLDLEPPQVVAGEVYAGSDLLAWLGLELPRLSGIRFGGDQQVRIVLDLSDLPAEPLEVLEDRGRRERGEPLRLRLPSLLLPLEPADPYLGFELALATDPGGTTVELSGPAFAYEVLALAAPSRLVIDAVPIAEPALPDLEEELAAGVRYRRFSAPNGVGKSLVHVLEVAPGAGQFRVVGESGTPRPMSELASGAFAAINAGYFDTRTFDAIGLLKVDYGLLSLPSRNRASVGFDESGAEIARVSAEARLWLAGRPYQAGLDDGELKLYTAAGARVGSPREGVVTVRGNRVVRNTVGPAEVPAEGFALVYPPDRRTLALLDAGDSASVDIRLEPETFRTARYAVEAGPLLLEDGRAAFAPDLERFPRGQRILDAYTQQAAIGVRADGTVLMVVAETMRAEDLIGLFLSLGARDAMRLDSGSSAMLYADGALLNSRRERRVVSAIVFVPSASITP